MSIDYDGVGGCGILITDEIIQKLISTGKITQDDWEDNKTEVLDKLSILYQLAGSSFSGLLHYYWIIQGSKLLDIISNVSEFIKQLSKIGIIITLDDIIVIEDILIS